MIREENRWNAGLRMMQSDAYLDRREGVREKGAMGENDEMYFVVLDFK